MAELRTAEMDESHAKQPPKSREVIFLEEKTTDERGRSVTKALRALPMESAAAEHVKKGEDKWCIVEYSETSSFYGLFDGHGGPRLATALAKKMPGRLKDAKTDAEITEAYYKVDYELGPKYATEGATAACARVEKTASRARVTFTWVGDSRSVAVDMASKSLVWQSSLHHVSNDDELDRVKLHWSLRKRRSDEGKTLKKKSSRSVSSASASSSPGGSSSEETEEEREDPIAALVEHALSTSAGRRRLGSSASAGPLRAAAMKRKPPKPPLLPKRSKTDSELLEERKHDASLSPTTTTTASIRKKTLLFGRKDKAAPAPAAAEESLPKESRRRGRGSSSGGSSSSEKTKEAPPPAKEEVVEPPSSPKGEAIVEGVGESGHFTRRRDRGADLTELLLRGQKYSEALLRSDEEHGVPLQRAQSFVGRRSNSEGRPVGPVVLQSVWETKKSKRHRPHHHHQNGGGHLVLGASTCVTRSMGDWDSSRCLLPHPEIAVDDVTLGATEAAVWKRYVLASDGLWDVASPQQVAKIIANEPTCALAADALIAAAQKRYLKLIDKSKPSGTDPFKDDTTVVVFDVRLGDPNAIPRPLQKYASTGSLRHRSRSPPLLANARKRLPVLC